MRSILLTPSVSSIKIPKHSRSFIKNIPEEEKDMAIIKAIIAFSKSLNLDLIREGVENAQQKKFLIRRMTVTISRDTMTAMLYLERIL